MLDFILGILKIIGAWILTQFLNKAFMDKKSPLYYEKLMEKLKLIIYAIRIWVLLALFNVLGRLGFFKSSNKGMDIKLVIAIVVGVLIVAVAMVYRHQEKKQEIA